MVMLGQLQSMSVAVGMIRSAAEAPDARVDVHHLYGDDGSRLRFRVYVGVGDGLYFWGETADAALWRALHYFKRKAKDGAER